MCLKGLRVLTRVLRSRRNVAEAEAAQDLADAAFVDRNLKAIGNSHRQVGKTPANDTILLRIRPVPYPRRQFRQLLRRQNRRAPLRLTVGQAFDTVRIITMDPIPQRLAVHTGNGRSFFPRLAFRH